MLKGIHIRYSAADLHTAKAVDAGVAFGWDADAVDRGGYPRVSGPTVDIGCYSATWPRSARCSRISRTAASGSTKIRSRTNISPTVCAGSSGPCDMNDGVLPRAGCAPPADGPAFSRTKS